MKHILSILIIYTVQIVSIDCICAYENPDIVPIQTIFLEAENQTGAGKTAIGEVIRTRAKREKSSWTAVCQRRYQFSCWNPGNEGKKSASRLSRMTANDWQECRKAWHESEFSQYSNNATHYFNPKLCSPTWARKMERVAKIGQHEFYREISGKG